MTTHFFAVGEGLSRSRGSVDLYARSGNMDNPDRNWSPWKLGELKKRRALGRASGALCSGRSAEIRGCAADVDSVVNYLSKNVAPEKLTDISVTPGVRYQPPPKVLPRTIMSAPGAGGDRRRDS